MKKKMFLALCLVFLVFGTCLAEEKPVKVEQLPGEVQQFIKTNYPSAQISSVTQEEDDKDFNVTLSEGTIIEFGGDNQWTEINSKRSDIPKEVLPLQVLEYVNATYSGIPIKKIERNKQGYNIQLKNKTKFQLDLQFKPTKFEEEDND